MSFAFRAFRSRQTRRYLAASEENAISLQAINRERKGDSLDFPLSWHATNRELCYTRMGAILCIDYYDDSFSVASIGSAKLAIHVLTGRAGTFEALMR